MPRIPIARSFLMAFACALALAACSAPNPDAEAACHPSHVMVTALKDAAHAGAMPAVDALMQAFLVEARVPGAAVGIVVNDQITYLQGYGVADLDSGRAFTVGTPSAVGSISKSITALAALRLAELGYLDLDAEANAYLPVSPPNWTGITVRDLLGHTSWLERDPTWTYPSSEDELKAVFGGDHPGIHPRQALLGYVSTQVVPEADRPTHLTGLYSNTGYSAAGAVIDAIAHEHGLPQAGGVVPHEGYEPFVYWLLGLRSGALAEPTMTTVCLNAYWRADTIHDLARGYRLAGDGQTLEPFMYQEQPQTGWEGPAGGWTMTIGDLTRLMLGMRTNAFVSAGSMAAMIPEHAVTDVGSYGLGVIRGQALGRPVWWHGGLIDGYTARYQMWPGQGVGVAILVNRRQGLEENLLGPITSEIAALFMP